MRIEKLIPYLKDEKPDKIINMSIERNLSLIIGECYMKACNESSSANDRYETFYDLMKLLGSKILKYDIKYSFDNGRLGINYEKALNFSPIDLNVKKARLLIGINEHLLEAEKSQIELKESLETLRKHAPEEEYKHVKKRLSKRFENI